MDLYQTAIELWGEDAQVNMAIEECAELIDAVSKYRRGRVSAEDVLSEIADVEIMMAQIKLIFDPNHADLGAIKTKKVNRLLMRIQNEKDKRRHTKPEEVVR